MDEHIYRRIFWPVLAPSILFGIAAGATVPVMVLAAIELGAPDWLAAAIVAVVGAVSLLTTVQAGRLIDRVGERSAMVGATAVAALLTCLTIAALVWAGPGALWLFVVSTAARAPAMNVWGLARQAFTAEHVAVHEVGRAMTALGGTMRIGNLIGPVIGGLLLVRCPLWSVFVLSIVCSVLAVVILCVPSLGGRLDGAAAAPTPGRRGRRQEKLAPLQVDWRRVVLAGISITCLALARVCQPVIVQLWGSHLGLHPSSISLLIAVGAAVEIVLMVPGGRVKDRLGRAAVLVICLTIYGSGFIAMVPLSRWGGIAGMVVAVMVMAVGNGLGAGVNMTIGADLSPSEQRGRFLGIWALFSNVGQLGGPALVSLLVARVSVAAAVFGVGGVAVAGALWMLGSASRIGLPSRVQRPGAAASTHD